MNIMRKILLSGVIVMTALLFSACVKSEAEAPLPVVKVYKTPTCGCCHKWVDHLEEAGFKVDATDMADVTPVKDENGVDADLRTCHTAVVDGYVIEGHVPAADIKRLLKERPAVAGLAVPGMPMGSPGMEGSRTDPYDVIAFDKEGNRFVFASH